MIEMVNRHIHIKYMGNFRQRIKERREQRAAKRSFGWLAEIPTLFLTALLITLYRYVHTLSAVSFDGAGYIEFWCTPHRLLPALHTSFLMVFVAAIMLIGVSIARELTHVAKKRWRAVAINSFSMILLLALSIVMHDEFGGLSCSDAEPKRILQGLYLDDVEIKRDQQEKVRFVDEQKT